MADLHADIGAGIASALATATGVQCEYANVSTKGPNESRSWVKPSTRRVLRKFDDTAESEFHFEVVFDLLDRDAPHTASTTVLDGLADSMGEVDGATLFAAITDAGSNIKASTLRVEFGTPAVQSADQSTTGEINGDADRPRILADIVVTCWHTRSTA